MAVLAAYYDAPMDWLFVIPFVLMVWYAIDREVVRYYRHKQLRARPVGGRETLASQVSRDFDPDRDERWRRCGECGCQHCVDLPDGSRFCPTCDSSEAGVSV